MSDEHKAKGNAAFQQKNYPEAIEHFTRGIEVDGTNHVLFSNRSACHAAMQNYQEALKDASRCVELAPQWAKGYSRLGAALEGRRMYADAVETYKKGLAVDPSMETLKQGLERATNLQKNPPHPLAQLFTPQLFTAIAMNNSPKMRKLREDKEFMEKVALMCKDSSQIANNMADPRVAELLELLMGGGKQDDDEPPAPKKPEPKPEPVKELTPEEKAELEVKQKADALKAEGNAFYKKKEFDQALEKYNAALEVMPTNIQYMNNIAAVYLERAEYEKCIEWCDKAVEVGKENRADFKDIGKALTRKGTCYYKQKDYDTAIQIFKNSLIESRSADTLDKLNKCQADKKKAEEEAYFSEELSEKAREEGNAKFREQQYAEAVELYTEAIKRNPKSHTPYSNRAAAYMKLGAYDDAEKDCNTCLKLEPTFVKAVTRLGHIFFFRKEYHKAMVQYQKGIDMDPTNEECRAGKQRTIEKVQQTSSGEGDEQRAQRAMADPEIQQILNDTYMQQVLREIQENPRNLQHYMKSPDVMEKINKLIAAGIIRTA